MATKFSQLPSGGLVQVGAQLVGLSASDVNTRYDFPGTGIRDSNGNMLLGWLPGSGTPTNYLQINSSSSGAGPILSAVGTDADIALIIQSKGLGDIYMIAEEYVEVISTGGFILPVGNTSQRPPAAAGAMRYNTDTGLIEYYDGLIPAWASIGTGSGSVTAVNGTPNRITSTGGTAPIIDIDINYVGQASITTVGTIVSGVWNGTLIDGAHGGTGFANTGKTIQLGGNISTAGDLTTVGAFASTFTMTGATNVTFPTSGTLITSASLTNYAVLNAQNNFGFNIQYQEQLKDYSETVYAAGNVSGAVTYDLTQGNVFTATSVGAITSTTVINVPAAGQCSSFTLLATNFGSASVTWMPGTVWTGSGAPSLQVAGTDVLTFFTIDGGTTWYGYLASASAGNVSNVSGGTGITVINGTTTPVVSISTGYTGQTSITTLGTIVTGTWNGTAIDVPHGGTGITSATAYSVLCGGTTSTGPFQSVAGLGSAGQVLTSNGAGSLPTWQPTGNVASVSGTLNRIDVTGTLTNPIVNISTNYVGQNTITTLGTIATGVWNGTGVTVPFGGTGVASVPAYAVVCGGTTTTGALQAVSGLGTAGYVLTSNGAGALPTWQVTGNVASITGGTGITVTGTPTVPIVSISATYAGQSSIVTVGTITSGTWNGSVVGVPYGGTGLASVTAYALVCGGTTGTGNLQTVSSTGTLGQVLTSAGPGALPTWTTPAAGSVTSVSGTANRITSSGGATPVIDISVSYVGQTSITTLGTIATGTWQGTLIAPAFGGTGVNNGSSTITLGGNLTTSGAFATTLTITGATNVTLPTSGTLATLGNNDFNFSVQYRPQLKDYSETVNALGNVSGGITIDLTLGNTVTATATGNITAITVTNVPIAGQEASFSLRATNFGLYTIAWPAGTQWPNGTTPALNAAGLSIVVFTTIDAGSTWQAFYPGQSVGSVTSVATGVGLTGGPITTSGTIALATNNKVNGRLTLTSNTPVTTTDVLAATTVYFTPYQGNYIDLYFSGSWKSYTFTQMSFAVPATTNQMYDVFIYNNSGTLAFNNVAWTNDTTRATPLAFQDGVYVLSGSPQYRYIGSFRTTGVSGQTEDSVANRLVFNYYNRVTRTMSVIAATTWSYAVNTIRQANASSTNQLNFVVGVSDSIVDCNVCSSASPGANNRYGVVYVGLNSTTAAITGSLFGAQYLATASQTYEVYATYKGYANAGYNYLAWLESSPSAGAVTYGTTTTNQGAITAYLMA